MPASLQWTAEEDEQLRELVEQYGQKAWAKIASVLRTKGSKQCRRRWKNFLNMSAKTCSWSPEEDATLIDAHRRLGNRWTEISKIFGDRTDNAVKNRWHALARKNPGLEHGEGGDDSDGAATVQRSKRRRTTRASAREQSELDSDMLDSAQYDDSSSQMGVSGGVAGGGAGGGVVSNGGLAAAALPTPFDQQATRRPTQRRGTRGRGGKLQPDAAAAAQYQLQQQLQQQQAAVAAAAAQQQAAQQQLFYFPQQNQAPLHITVTKDFLSPWEQQLADQINAMNLPVHVEVSAAPLPTLDSLQLPESMLPPDMVVQRSSWKQFVEKLEEPGDSKGLQELLDWFSNNSGPQGSGLVVRDSSGSKELALLGNQRMTRSMSLGRSSSGSGSLGGDHRQLLVKLMSRGLEARSSGDQRQEPPTGLNGGANGGGGTTAGVDGGAAGAGGGGFNGAPASSGVIGSIGSGGVGAQAAAIWGQSAMAAAAAAGATAGAVGMSGLSGSGLPPRFDPMKRTRSSSLRLSTDLDRALAALGQHSYRASSSLLPLPSLVPRNNSGGRRGGSAPSAAAAAAAVGGAEPPPPLPDPTPLGFDRGYSDVLVTPSFSSQEIALLIDALKPRNDQDRLGPAGAPGSK